MAADPAGITGQRRRMRAELARLSGHPTALDRALGVVVRGGFRVVGWRVRAEGLDRLPRDRGGQVTACVLAVAPHRGWMDPFILVIAWPRDAPRLAWFGDGATMARSWWRRRLLPRLGMIPIGPETTPGAVRDHLADARTVLARGACLVVFPEKGAPSPRGSTRTIAPGAAWLAAAGGVPLVPIALGGFLETGLGTHFRLRVLDPCAAPTIPPDTGPGRQAARKATEALRVALAPAVSELEDWSATRNANRPLPWLRRLFN